MNKRLKYTYKAMKQRCYNSNNKSYKNYGGRGITICDDWLNSYESFEKWAVSNGYNDTLGGKENSIDRIDVNGNYESNNCRWVNMKIQARNTRRNVWLDIDGERVLLKDCENYFNMTSDNIRKRQLKFNGNIDMIKEVPKYKRLGIIVQKDLNGKIIKKYDTLKEIKEKYNYDLGNISNCLYNRRKTAYGYIWEYEINKYCDSEKTKYKISDPKDKNMYNFLLENYTNGKKTLKECADELNLTTGGLSNYLTRYKLRKQQNGGRPKKIILENEKDIIDLLNQNYKPRTIAYKLNVDVKKVYYIKQIKDKKPI